MNLLSNKSSSSGFGMLDALIGVVILALVGVSSHSTTSTGFQSTDKIRKRLIASWVAENRITQMTLEARYLKQMDLGSQSTKLAGFNWLTEAVVENTTSSLARVKVEVMEDNGRKATLHSSSTYLPVELLP